MVAPGARRAQRDPAGPAELRGERVAHAALRAGDLGVRLGRGQCAGGVGAEGARVHRGARAAFEFFEQVGHVVVTPFGLGLHRLAQREAELVGKTLEVGRVRALAREEVVRGFGECVDVGPLVDRAGVVELLGGDVGQRAHAHAGFGQAAFAAVSADLGEPEVDELRCGFVVDQDVRRLHVAVVDRVAVREREGFTDAADDAHGLVDVERPAVGDEGAGVLALDVLHHDERAGLIAFEREDAHDVGVAQLRDRAGFAHEALHGFLVADLGAADSLYGDVAVEIDIMGPVDDAHPALAEAFDDAVLSAGDGAETLGRFVGGVGVVARERGEVGAVGPARVGNGAERDRWLVVDAGPGDGPEVHRHVADVRRFFRRLRGVGHRRGEVGVGADRLVRPFSRGHVRGVAR